MRNLFSPQSFRDYPEFSNHEMLIALSDEAVGLTAYVGIHSSALGPALGGTRYQEYDSPEEALRDALNLSSAMSYKCALAGLPYGGGKGVIFVPKGGVADREALLSAYAKAVENLRGLFRTGTDVGISDDDVRHMAASTKYMLGVSEFDRGNLTTSGCAAQGVFVSIQSALQTLYGDSQLRGRRVAIKGVGKLGGELARLASEAGAEVLIADTNQANLDKVTAALPAVNVVPADRIAEQEVDIYAPCALGSEFTRANIKKLRCKVICGGANNQLASPNVAELLHKHGVVYVPDYIANGGGLIYVADELEPGGFSQERVKERIENIGQTVSEILARSKTENVSPSLVADKIAEERIRAKTV
jgi:glutamate dehydrogenase/leucine dehydrogenase